MNSIIYGNHIEWYDLINSFATVASEIIVFLNLDRFVQQSTFPKIFQDRIDKNKNMRLFSKCFTFAFCVLSIFIITALSEKSVPHISEMFLKTTDDNYFSNIFVVPIASFIMALIIKITPSLFVDVTALCCSVSLIFFKVACYFCGCCNGVEYDGIFYNQSKEQFQVPIQLIELACAVVMFILLAILFKFKKAKGNLFPLFMIMYCGSRFCSEFWRGDYPTIVGNLTGYHIQCIIGFVLGTIYLLIGLIFGKKINLFVQKRNDAFVEKAVAKLPDFKKENPQLWEIIKYLVAGIVPSGFELVVHMFFVNTVFYNLKNKYFYNPLLYSIGLRSVGYFWAFVISTLVGYSIGFVLSRKFVFRSDANPKKSIIKYVFVVIITVFLSGWIGSGASWIAQQIHFTGTLEDVIVKVITMIIPTIWAYPANKYFVHKDIIKK